MLRLSRHARRRKGQGSFEYLLLLAGVLLIVVIVIGILRSTTSQVENSSTTGINTTLGKFNQYANISNENLSGLPGSTAAPVILPPTPTPVERCRDGTNASSCVLGRPPLYCRFGGTDYVDRCDACGCPAGKSCDPSSKRCGVFVTPEPPGVTPATALPPGGLAPTPRPVTGVQVIDDTINAVNGLFNTFTSGIASIANSFGSLLAGGSRLVTFLIAIGIAAIGAFAVYALLKKHKD